MVEVIETTPEKLFSEIDLEDEGFVLLNANDCDDFSNKISEFTKLAHEKSVVFTENPWRTAYKIKQHDGRVSIVLVAERNARDLNLPRWIGLNGLIVNGFPLNQSFGLLSAFHKAFLQNEKKKHEEKTEKNS